MKKNILLLGYGAMGRDVHAQLRDDQGVRIACILEQASRCAEVQQEVGGDCQVVSTLDALSARPDFALECAGHAAAHTHVPALLRRGIDTIMASVGSLAAPGFAALLAQACEEGGAQLILVPGALAGIDALSAARHYGLDEVHYIGRKPPTGWIGTLAEELCDLRRLQAPAVFFDGTARDAALQYPQNANVAAMIGLAGLGLDDTRVQLIADPGVTRNTHTFVARGAVGQREVKVEGNTLAANPKTSALAAMSIVRQVRNQVAALVF